MSHLSNTGVPTLALEYKDLSTRVIEYELDRLTQITESMQAPGSAPLNLTNWGSSDTSSISAQGVGESAQCMDETTYNQNCGNNGMTDLVWDSVNEQNMFFQ